MTAELLLLAANGSAVAAVAPGTSPFEVGVGSTVLRADAFAIVMLILVVGLSAVIQVFASRYLRGDVRRPWFVLWANSLTAFTGLLVCAGSVLTFVAGWIGAGASLVFLLAMYWSESQSREGVRRTALSFAIGDGILVAAVIPVLITAGGDVRLSDVGEIASSMNPAVASVVAVLLIVPALSRSSQLPFVRWLPATLAAPTPVSALMHAGVVNAGAVLLVRFSPVVSAHALAMGIVFAAGAATLVFASAVRIVKPDTKGRLVYSTMAQMGFMIMTCGLGAYPAAVLHLIGHSLYKSNLFLRASMVVRQHAWSRELPAPARPTTGLSATAIVLAVIVPTAALLVGERLISHTASITSLSLLWFVAASGAVSLGAALVRRSTPLGSVVVTVAVVAIAVTYLLVVTVMGDILQLPKAATTMPAWLLVFPAAALLSLDVLRVSRTAPAGLRRAVYATALSFSTPRSIQSKGSVW